MTFKIANRRHGRGREEQEIQFFSTNVDETSKDIAYCTFQILVNVDYEVRCGLEKPRADYDCPLNYVCSRLSISLFINMIGVPLITLYSTVSPRTDPSFMEIWLKWHFYFGPASVSVHFRTGVSEINYF